jgi:hypothetical protein
MAYFLETNLFNLLVMMTYLSIATVFNIFYYIII